MARSRKSAPQRPEKGKEKVPWHEHRFTLSLKAGWAVFYTLAGAVFVLLLNAPTLLENLRKLPADLSSTVSKFESWVYEDAEWTGNWSSFPEGIVDMADMNLSDTDLRITIWSKEGVIDGTIVTSKVCKTLPFDYVLLRGEVSGNKAEVTAWDTLGGHDQNLARLTLSRDDDVLTVTSIEDPLGWFPTGVRIGRTPSDEGVEIKPDMEFCRTVRKP